MSAGSSESLTPVEVSYLVDREGSFDLEFQPLNWEPGNELSVESGPVRLQSRAGLAGRHAISWEAPAHHVRRLLGVLDGRVHAEYIPDPSVPGDGGETLTGPTSVHRRTICEGPVCAEVIEYDYNQTAPDGHGTTEWARPGGKPVVVDHLRFEVAAVGPEQSAVDRRRLKVTSPVPLQAVR